MRNYLSNRITSESLYREKVKDESSLIFLRRKWRWLDQTLFLDRREKRQKRALKGKTREEEGPNEICLIPVLKKEKQGINHEEN